MQKIHHILFVSANFVVISPDLLLKELRYRHEGTLTSELISNSHTDTSICGTHSPDICRKILSYPPGLQNKVKYSYRKPDKQKTKPKHKTLTPPPKKKSLVVSPNCTHQLEKILSIFDTELFKLNLSSSSILE